MSNAERTDDVKVAVICAVSALTVDPGLDLRAVSLDVVVASVLRAHGWNEQGNG